MARAEQVVGLVDAPVPTQKPIATERSSGMDSVSTRSPEGSRVRSIPSPSPLRSWWRIDVRIGA